MKNYKAKLRIPTDMYAYVEIDIEDTPENIMQAYKDFRELYRETSKVEDKEIMDTIEQKEKKMTQRGVPKYISTK